ncbi:MAG TPA: hypothetical protein VFQ20_08875, partial [Burkholderiaceae bacterium]|nr:hypothetical protein [Burkholderiaceae bacterium]
QVDDVPFTATPSDLLSRKGKPAMTARNGIGLDEMDYGDSVFRFQDSGQLEEVTRRTSVLQLPNAAVPLKFLGRFVREQDTSSFERGGFIVSPKFGFAFAPESSDWVTALARHCIDTWRALR